jgi:3-oxoadipate enol-lactonase
MRELIAPVNGVDLAYAIEGSGPVVVLIHGLACGRRMWRHQVADLRSSFTVLSYDQRGHGRSTAPAAAEAYSPAHLGRDLVGLLDHLGIDRCHLVGFSLGGGPALALAASRPDRVASLTLADVGAGAESPTVLASVTRRWAELGRGAGMSALAEEMLRGEFYKHYASSSPRARRHMRALIMRTPLHGLLFTLSEILAKRRSLYRMGAVLGSIRTPTLVMRGEHDNVCRAASKLLAAGIPGATAVVVPRAGHMAPLEAPIAFNDVLGAFLSRTAGLGQS